MERGEQSVAIAVLSVIGIVGVLASVTLFMKAPSGLVMQGQSIYVTENAANLQISCSNPSQQVVFLGYENNYQVWCCIEKMIGQNTCMEPHKVSITRK